MRASKIKQSGVGLIEVMVALLVLAVAVLGYAAMQTQAIKVTDESLERSQSLVMMRNIGEKVRANPTAIATYESNLNGTLGTSPTNKCGLDGSASPTLCTPEQLAIAETYYFKTKIANYGFDVQLHPCPSTGGTAATADTSIMYSYCLLAAWGNTTATIGDDATSEPADANDNKTMDCLTPQVKDKDNNVTSLGGSYHPKATCMMMEI